MLDHDIRRALACAPSDAFLWTVLAWLDGAREGFRNEQFTYLRLSYRLGPKRRLDRRTPQSLRPRHLPPAAGRPRRRRRPRVRPHGRQLDLSGTQSRIFTGPGWPIHERLLASLKDVGLHQREGFYIELYTEGYNVVVPGVAPRDPRPWY